MRSYDVTGELQQDRTDTLPSAEVGQLLSNAVSDLARSSNESCTTTDDLISSKCDPGLLETSPITGGHTHAHTQYIFYHCNLISTESNKNTDKKSRDLF